MSVLRRGLFGPTAQCPSRGTPRVGSLRPMGGALRLHATGAWSRRRGGCTRLCRHRGAKGGDNVVVHTDAQPPRCLVTATTFTKSDTFLIASALEPSAPQISRTITVGSHAGPGLEPGSGRLTTSAAPGYHPCSTGPLLTLVCCSCCAIRLIGSFQDWHTKSAPVFGATVPR